MAQQDQCFQALLETYQHFSRFAIKNHLQIGLRYRRIFTLVHVLIVGSCFTLASVYIYRSIMHNQPLLSGYCPCISSSPMLSVFLFVIHLLILVYVHLLILTDYMITVLMSVTKIKLQILKKKI